MKILIASLLCLSLLFAGCASKITGTATGAAIGAVTGGGIGYFVAKQPGALVGAGLGALTGGIIGFFSSGTEKGKAEEKAPEVPTFVPSHSKTPIVGKAENIDLVGIDEPIIEDMTDEELIAQNERLKKEGKI